VVCVAPQNRRPLFIHAPNRLASTATASTSTAASIQISQFSLFSLFMIAYGALMRGKFYGTLTLRAESAARTAPFARGRETQTQK
jgi:hypothetical protein